jgi:energy-coupling factor transporter ATP-binding protein EcfA2
MEVYNHPDMEITQMLLLSGVANMLLPIVSNQRGGLLLVLSGRSGVGKTTLLRFMGSLIGDPDRCMVPGSSTPNALVNMLKQSQFFMLPVDDTMKMDATQLSLLLTSVSSGMERMRLTTTGPGGSYIAEWAEPFHSSLLVTSNYSMESIIGTGGADTAQLQSDAAQSRLLEIPANLIQRTGTDAKLWQEAEQLIADNYGHPVELMAAYLAVNQETIRRRAYEMRASIETALLSQTPLSEQGVARFWARYIACVGITGYILCDKLNVLPWSYKSIVSEAVKFVLGHHAAAEQERTEAYVALWDLLSNDMDGRLKINFSYLTSIHQDADDWPQWDDDAPRAAQKRRYHSKWDAFSTGSALVSNHSSGPSVATLMQGSFRWRVILTVVNNTAGVPQYIERHAYIPLQTLMDLVDQHAKTLRVSGWEELYYSLVLGGCPVKGVNPQRPTKVGRKEEQVRTYIDATQKSRGELKTAVRIMFPPLPIESLDAG